MAKLKKKTLIKQLLAEKYSLQQAADLLADDLASIMIAYREGEILGLLGALHAVEQRHQAIGKAVH